MGSINAGIYGTGALVARSNSRFTQWLDMSCLLEGGGEYILHASYRTVDQIENIENAQDLKKPSPLTQLIFEDWDEEKQAPIKLPSSYLLPTQPSKNPNPGFRLMSGSFTITPEQAAGVKARILFTYFHSFVIFDDISLVRVG